MGKRYQGEKVQGALLDGGFGKHFSKRVSSFIHARDSGEPTDCEQAALCKPPAAPFDPLHAHDLGFVGMDGSVEVANKALAGMMATFAQQYDATIKKKVQDLEKNMGKKGWKGAMAKLEACVAIPSGFEADENDFQMKPGAEPWLACYKKNCWRYGPQDFPLLGCSCFVYALTGPMVVNMFVAEGVIAQGLAVPDL